MDICILCEFARSRWGDEQMRLMLMNISLHTSILKKVTLNLNENIFCFKSTASKQESDS